MGAGGPGLTILYRGDLEGVTTPGPYFYRDEGPYDGTLGRWTGGLGHELGHGFGLPHPPGCDEGLPTCDSLALMANGYEIYPETYLRADNKEVLIRSPFIGREPASALDSFDAPNASSVQGLALGLDGEPVEGLRVSLAPCGSPSIARQLSMEYGFQDMLRPGCGHCLYLYPLSRVSTLVPSAPAIRAKADAEPGLCPRSISER